MTQIDKKSYYCAGDLFKLGQEDPGEGIGLTQVFLGPCGSAGKESQTWV